MKNGFYMGYDASMLNEQELLRQARLLVDNGFYAAGYEMLCLGDMQRFEQPAQLAQYLCSIGFKLNVTIPCTLPVEEADTMVKTCEPAMITLAETADHNRVEQMAKHCQSHRIAVSATDEDLAWAGKVADVVALNVLTECADYFDITRHQLDSCRNDDVDTALSNANLRAAALQTGGVYHVGNLPYRFDYYRNEAIFLNMCMLGCPLVLSGDIAALPARYAALVCNEKLIHLARLGTGHVARYYDPWHLLLSKAETEKSAYALILNRCHGDQPTNILPNDLGWEGRFQLRSWPQDELLGVDLETYEAHVETSDHPQTPCCRLYRLERL